MKRTGLFLAGILALSACGGSGDNPLTGGTDPEDPETGTGGLEGSASFTGEVNLLSYDADADEVIINNLPFDGPDGVYVNTGIKALGAFGVYESIQTTETGQRKYYAVYTQSDSGAISAGAVGTGDYADFGYGGSALARSTTSVAIPTSGEAVYRGDYGGVRILDETAVSDPVQLVSGTAIMQIDFADFDVIGAVEGDIVNRNLYDRNGNFISTLPSIVMGTGAIDEDGNVSGGGAFTFDSEGNELQSGTWEGLFGGDNAEELAGVIIITGPEIETPENYDEDVDGPIADSRETGVFVTID